MDTKKKRTPNQKKKAIVSVLLMVAILITGAFAFLSATDSKTNVFTVGNVKIKLSEEFDTNQNGSIEKTNDENDEVYDASETQVSLKGEILPGQKVIKRPYVENTGKNKAWVYITVGIPTTNSDNTFRNKKTGETSITGQNVDIPIRAYAIQENYANKTTYKDVWNAYFADKITDTFGAEVTDAKTLSERVPLFEILNKTRFNEPIPDNISVDDNIPNDDWENIGITVGGLEKSYYKSANYDYYVFAYKTLLDPTADGAEQLSRTSDVFEGVRLLKDIGEAQPSKLNYYIKETAGVTLNGEVDLSVEPSTYDGYRLVKTEYYMPGERVRNLYYDDTLAETGYSFNWNFMNDKTKSAYSGMIITEDTDLVANWVNYTDIANPEGSKYLFYGITYIDNEFAAVVTGADKTSLYYPTTPETVIIPATISFTKLSENEYVIDNGIYREVTDFGGPDFRQHKDEIKIGTKYTIPVKYAQIETQYDRMLSGVALREVAKKVIVGDNVKFFGQLFETFGGLDTEKSSSTLEEIVLPYNCSEAISFAGQTSLKTVILPNTLKSIYPGGFANTAVNKFVVPNSVTDVGSNAFENCEQLTTVSILGEVKTLRETFKNCKNLTSITLPNSLETIEYRTFSNCDSLTDIIIPNSVTSINECAFENCTSLINITVPDGLMNISSSAFNSTGYYNNQNNWDDEVLYLGKHLIKAEFSQPIETYTVKKDTKSLAGGAFQNQNIKNINLPDGLKSIGANTFSGCVSLTNIIIPNSVTNIGVGAFEWCTGLTSITIPDSVTSIMNCIFEGCSNLKNITLPNTVTYIGYGAFLGTNLQIISIPVSLQSIDGFLFGDNIPKTIIYQGSVSQFKSIQNYYCIGKGATIICSDGPITIE